MTIALSSGDDRPDRGTYALVLMSAGAPEPDGVPSWPGRVRCDPVDVPLEACCGVITHLDRAGVGLCRGVVIIG